MKVARSMRRLAFKLAKRGEAKVRVVGSTADGFQLVAMVWGDAIPFGHPFERRKDAVLHAERATGQKATALSRAKVGTC